MAPPSDNATPPRTDQNGADGGTGNAPMLSVPRIAIDVFCENQETRRILEQASKDRHLAKARVNFQPGGPAQAVTLYQQQGGAPELIVLETSLRGEEMLQAARELGQACGDPGRLVIIGHINDINIYRDMMRLGVSEYLSTPITPRQVVETIAELYADPDAAPLGRSSCFIGARGGVGSSTIAHNVAWFIANDIKMDVSVVDLDLPFGSTGLNFNLNPGRGLADALTAPERLDDVLLERLLMESGERMSIFASDIGLEESFDHVPPQAYETVLEVVRRAVPQTVVDIPCVWTEWTRRVLLGADNIVITAALDLVSLRNARNITTLLKQERPDEKEPYLLLNQVGISKRKEISQQNFIEALEFRPHANIPFAPQVFGEAANNGLMLAETRGGGEIGQILKRLAYVLTGRRAPPAGLGTLWRWLPGGKKTR